MEGGSIAPASGPSPPPAAAVNILPSSSVDGAGSSSLYIVLVLVAVAVLATIVIRCLMTCHCEVICCGWRWRHPSAAVADVPELTPDDGRSASNTGKGDAVITSDKEKIASAAGRHSPFSLPTLSRECAVCLSPLQHGEELRILSACGHAFHAPCVDTWLSTTPSCPLCRTSVTFPVPPTSFLPSPPGSGRWRPSSGSFHIESANRRPNPAQGETRRPNPVPVPQRSAPPVMRTYSIGLNEVEAEPAVAQIGRPTTEKKDKPSEAINTVPPIEGTAEGGRNSGRRSGRWPWEAIITVPPTEGAAEGGRRSGRRSGRWPWEAIITVPPTEGAAEGGRSSGRRSGRWPWETIITVPPTEGVAEGGRGSGRRSGRWLWNYIDRFAPSASSSMRFSGRWSRRYDAGDGRYQFSDSEGSSRREEEDGVAYSFYRWLMGE